MLRTIFRQAISAIREAAITMIRIQNEAEYHRAVVLHLRELPDYLQRDIGILDEGLASVASRSNAKMCDTGTEANRSLVMPIENPTSPRTPAFSKASCSASVMKPTVA